MSATDPPVATLQHVRSVRAELLRKYGGIAGLADFLRQKEAAIQGGLRNGQRLRLIVSSQSEIRRRAARCTAINRSTS